MRNDRWFSRACPWSSPLANWEAPTPCGEATPARCSIATLRRLAAEKAKLAFCLGPAMRRPVLVRWLPRGWRGRAARMGRPPIGRRFPSSRQGRNLCLDQTGSIKEATWKLIATRRPIRPRFDLCSRRIRGRWISLFMALLSLGGQSNPGLHAQGEQRRSSYCNNDRDIALSQSETFQSFKFCNKLLQFVCCRNQAFRIQSL